MTWMEDQVDGKGTKDQKLIFLMRGIGNLANNRLELVISVGGSEWVSFYW